MQFGGVQVGVVSAQAALDALSPCKQVAVRRARRRPGWGQANAVDGHQGRVHVLYEVLAVGNMARASGCHAAPAARQVAQARTCAARGARRRAS